MHRILQGGRCHLGALSRRCPVTSRMDGYEPMTTTWCGFKSRQTVYEMNKQSDCGFDGIESLLLASCKCSKHKEYEQLASNK